MLRLRGGQRLPLIGTCGWTHRVGGISGKPASGPNVPTSVPRLPCVQTPCVRSGQSLRCRRPHPTAHINSWGKGRTQEKAPGVCQSLPNVTCTPDVVIILDFVLKGLSSPVPNGDWTRVPKDYAAEVHFDLWSRGQVRIPFCFTAFLTKLSLRQILLVFQTDDGLA